MKFLRFKDIKIADTISQDIYPEVPFRVDGFEDRFVVLSVWPRHDPEEIIKLTPLAFERMKFVTVLNIMRKRFGKNAK
ncbi:hypothetical protein ES703_40122 [subsurface metagenome]